MTHLNLIREGLPTHAAVLLFGSAPLRFLLSSEVKGAHFHGTRVAKPIPSYQVYKGTVFDLVDQAVDFVLSKINLAVGTREHSTQARDTAGGRAGGDRQRRRPPRLHQYRQRAGHVVRRPAGTLEPRHAAAVADPGNALTIPDKPRSRLQKYRLTDKGQMLRDRLQERKRTR